jgi:hypothetical protein
MAIVLLNKVLYLARRSFVQSAPANEVGCKRVFCLPGAGRAIDEGGFAGAIDTIDGGGGSHDCE